MTINSSYRAYKYLRRVMGFEQEEFWTLALDSSNQLIQMKRIFIGTVDSCQVHPRDIYRFAIQQNASRLIVAHCHPSGNPLPSENDLKITKRLQRTSRLVGIPLLDHLILTQREYVSFADKNLLR